MLVKRCLNGEACENFDSFFETRTHEKSTRKNSFLMQVPKQRLRFTKSGVRSKGMKFYNSLAIENRQAEWTGYFRNFLRKCF